MSSQLTRPDPEDEKENAPWEVIRWMKLKKITGQAFSEQGKRSFGRSTCLAVSGIIALGTSKGSILIFDYHQTLKYIIGPGTKAAEAGAITALAISADHSTVAGGHIDGSIFTWEVAKSARPFLHIPPHDISEAGKGKDGHVGGSAVVHLGFLGTRHTALVSGDDRGMAFSHLATRGLGAVGRIVKTARVLGRYPHDLPADGKPRKPSSLLALAQLPLGNVEQATDTLGLVAMLTPYLLVIVSTTPVAQTQHKAARPKEIVGNAVLSGCLAWFPSVKLKAKLNGQEGGQSKSKLAYVWSNVLTVLDIHITSEEDEEPNAQPNLHFKPRSRWRAPETIVAVQWLSRSVLGVLTISQRLYILEEPNLRVTDTFDLIHKQIFHQDLFSKRLQALTQDEGEDDALHALVADAFYASFKVYKSKIFLLGINEISIGALTTWSERLDALVEAGDPIEALQLATAYYNGDADKLSVGLPEDDTARHNIVAGKLLDLVTETLKRVFDRDPAMQQLEQLANSCFDACMSMEATDFLFDDVWEHFDDNDAQTVFLETLEPYITDRTIESIPPVVIKALIEDYSSRGLGSRLEEIICKLDTSTMAIEQVTLLCKQHQLYDALAYVWNIALGDYITPLVEMFELVKMVLRDDSGDSPFVELASKIFPYLSFSLTGRIYPTGEDLDDVSATKAKSALYNVLFSGRPIQWPAQDGPTVTTQEDGEEEPLFPYLRLVLNFDAPSFLSMLNEAFEDPFLNGSQDQMVNGTAAGDRGLGRAVNRQFIISILLQVMVEPDFDASDTVYLDMFIARNLPKFQQFLMLPGSALQGVLSGLCHFPSEDIAEDCQLSAEYLLSVYHPPDILSLIPLFEEAHFYRVLKGIYKQEEQYSKMIETCLIDEDAHPDVIHTVAELLRPSRGLSSKQLQSVRQTIQDKTPELAKIDAAGLAETIEHYASDMHDSTIHALDDYPYEQFLYLQVLLEPKDNARHRDHDELQELYIKLLCEFAASRVADYVENLQTADLHLQNILPAMESAGAIDAAVVLIARDGLVRKAMDRLLKHLEMLDAGLSGLLKARLDDTGDASVVQSAQGVCDSLEQYAAIGIWLCQGQISGLHKSAKKREEAVSKTDLSMEEGLWLDLTDAVVRVLRNASHVQMDAQNGISNDDVLLSLRNIVQKTFTALLTATSTSKGATRGKSLSFTNILRAFLVRASIASPSLSDLRQVLATIFEAYAYEQSLLDLSSKLLADDLFLHVSEGAQLRRRGWRPLGHNCEACGKIVWGAGAGSKIFAAWETRTVDIAMQDKDRRLRQRREAEERTGIGSQRRGKSRARDASLLRDDLERKRSQSRTRPIEPPTTEQSTDQNDETDDRSSTEEIAPEPEEEELGPIVIFACRHVFHEKCLEDLQSSNAARAGGDIRSNIGEDRNRLMAGGHDHSLRDGDGQGHDHGHGHRPFSCIVCK